MTGMYAHRLRPEWEHLAPSSLISAQEIGTLMLTRYADDWVAVWNGSRDRAEIKAEIKAFLANVLKLKLSEEKTLITHIDDGFQFWAIKFRVTNAGQMDSGACFHEYPKGDSTLSMPSRQLPKHVHR